MPSGRTPSQTIGPFFGVAIPHPDERFVVPEGTEGAFWIRGRVLDGAGDPVPDAMIETWQTGPMAGFARSATDGDGRWEVQTVRPTAVASDGGGSAASWLAVSVFARGLLKRLVTRIYLPEADGSAPDDGVLARLDQRARASLIAKAAVDGYRFDIVLQGESETPFFDV